MATTRVILHLDLDAFFCAVEEQRDPDLKGKPFAVGGRPDERGVVAACSYTARAFGIRSAMPMARAIRFCPQLIIIPGHYSEYARASRQVMDLLREVAPVIEQISIDEAFLDLTDSPQPPEQIAREIQESINNELQLPCSLGLASNKLVAKIATDYGKSKSGSAEKSPNAIQIVPAGEEAAFLAPLPVDALWGVGPKTSHKLAEMGLKTIGDIARIPEDLLIESFGKNGHDLSLRARGIDDRSVSGEHVVKSISQETTFAKDVKDHDALIEVIESMSNKVSGSLSRRHLEAKTIKIKFRWPDFTTLSRQSTLNQPTDKAIEIREAAIDLFHQVWKSGQAVRLIGVGVAGVAPLQLRLWDVKPDRASSEKETRLDTVLKDIKEKFGADAIIRGKDLNK